MSRTNQSRTSKMALAAMLALGGFQLVGCAGTHGESAVPDRAIALNSDLGRDRVVRAHTPHAGKAWVLDDTDNRVLWSGKVRRDAEISVDARNNLIVLDGRTVAEPRMDRDHRYVIKFLRPD